MRINGGFFCQPLPCLFSIGGDLLKKPNESVSNIQFKFFAVYDFDTNCFQEIYVIFVVFDGLSHNLIYDSTHQ